MATAQASVSEQQTTQFVNNQSCVSIAIEVQDGDIQIGSIKNNKWAGAQTLYYSDGSIENKSAKGKKSAVKEPKQALFGTGKAKNQWSGFLEWNLSLKVIQVYIWCDFMQVKINEI